MKRNTRKEDTKNYNIQAIFNNKSSKNKKNSV